MVDVVRSGGMVDDSLPEEKGYHDHKMGPGKPVISTVK